MSRLIAVLALAGAAAFAARPASNTHTRLAAPAPAVAERAAEVVVAQAEKDFARRQAEVGLVGAAPLFGAEGLPKPTR
ncbi:MAG TPA: hypothetical protein VFS78_17725 [Vicinamibacteria bacterium]|nr:hypothetical protein [Vicinamibacteria bacterium]